MKQIIALTILVFLTASCRSAALQEAQVEKAPTATPDHITATTLAATDTPQSTDTPVPATATPVAATPTETPLPTAEPATATPTTAPLPEPEDLWGRWANLLFSLSLMPDGSYEVVWPSESDTQSYELGTYTFDQGVLTFVPETFVEEAANPTLDGCREKQPYSYEVTVPDDPRFMRLNQMSYSCEFRSRHWDSAGTTTDEVWQQLEKYSPK